MDVDGEPAVTVNIRCSNGNNFSVKTNLQSSVYEFKTLLAQNCDVPPEQQRLIYKGRILKDEQTLQSYGLQADHTVHMVRGFAPNPSASSTPTNDVNASNIPAVTQGSVPNTGSTGLAGASTGTGAALFPGLGLGALGGTGAPGLFGAGFPEFEQVQRQLTQNPNTMRDIMSLPVFQNLMNNQEIMRSMIMSNPQMRDIIDRNPDLGHILNDPGTLRQTLEAARNPELMREMMRNTDRAMSNIESSPEGFNALRRVYENVQEPLMNATTMAGSGAAFDSGSNPFAALLGNQGGNGNQTRDVPNSAPAGTETTSGTDVPNSNPLPNPWSNNGTQTNSVIRTNPVGSARPPSIAGLGGLGLPDMGTLDPSLYSQLLQNPAMIQTMQSLLSNPRYMEQMVSLNPQLRSMLDMNPQLREMMQNPDFLRQLASPQSMQQMMALIQLSQLGRQQATPEGGAQTTQNMENQMNLNFLMDMLGRRGAGGMNVPSNPNVPPEELYATQLSQLQEMGFFDMQENIRALRAASGNVHAAVELLLNNPGL